MSISFLLYQQYSARRLPRGSNDRPASSLESSSETHGECYINQVATICCRQRRRQCRPAQKLHTQGGVVHHFLRERLSPEQIALTMESIYPKGHELRVSTETVYNCIYAQPVGQLKKELIRALRHANNKRVPESKGQARRGQTQICLAFTCAHLT